MSNIVNVPEPRFNPLGPALIKSDIVQKENKVFLTDTGNSSFSAFSDSGYRFTTKDLDSFHDLSEAWLDIELTSAITSGSVLAAVAGAPVVASTSVGSNYLPQVAAQTNATLVAVNTALATRYENDGSRTDAVGVMNGYSIFKTATLTVNDVRIESNRNPAHTAYMKFVSEKNKNNGEALEQCCRLYAPERVTPDRVAEVEAGSTHLSLPLTYLFDFCESHKMMRGMSYQIELTGQSSMAAIIQSVFTKGAGFLPTGGNGIYISNIKLVVPTVYPSMEAIQRYESALLSGGKAVQFFQGSTYQRSQSYADSTLSVDWNVMTSSKKVEKVFVWLNSVDYETTYVNRNDLRNDIDELSSVEVEINGDRIPKASYTFNLSNNDIHRCYHEFLQACGKSVLGNDAAPVLSMQEWKASQNIFCFNVPNNTEKLYEQGSNTIVIRSTLSGTATPSNYYIHALIKTANMVAYSSHDGKIALEY